MRAGIVVNVTPADRRRLEAIVADRSAPQKHVWPANIILATADGCGTAEIIRRSGKSKPVVWRWQARFMAEGAARASVRVVGPLESHPFGHGFSLFGPAVLVEGEFPVACPDWAWVDFSVTVMSLPDCAMSAPTDRLEECDPNTAAMAASIVLLIERFIIDLLLISYF
jgi:hypothetical protein